MKKLFKNPFTIWLLRLMRSTSLEMRHRKGNLKIGYMSNIRNCEFGIFNTVFDSVSLNGCTLGDFSYVASGTEIAKTRIGKFCSIGSDCKIGLGKHPSKVFVSTHPIFYSTLKQAQISFAYKNFFNESEEINIGNDVWVGANVIISDGVKIGDGVIVAAGSVVTKDIPSYAIVGGVPAMIIRYRFDENDVKKLLELRWWNMDVEILRKDFQRFHNVREFLKESE